MNYLAHMVLGQVHGLDEEGHWACTAATSWEFVDLSASICGTDSVTGTVSSGCALNTVRALGQVLEVRLNTCSTAVGLSVHSYRNDTCVDTVVVCFLNGGCIVRLLLSRGLVKRL